MSQLYFYVLVASFVVASTIATPCSNFYSPSFSVKEGRTTDAIPSLAKPAKAVPFADPTYKTCLYRATNYASDGMSGFAINDYSRRQPFNADGSIQLVYALDGYWWTINTTTSRPVSKLIGPAGDSELQWHPTDPKTLYYLPTYGVGMKIYSLNVLTVQSTVVADLSARLTARWASARAAWTKSEGSPSANGRYWCMMVDDADWSSVGVFTFDLQTNTILGYLNTNGKRPDHVSMTPTGNYCVVSWLDDTSVFNRDMTNKRTILASSQHSDIALGADGDDYFVALDYASNTGDVFMTNLRTLVKTVLFPTYFGDSSTLAYHISGKAFNYPGYFIMSTYATTGPNHWNHNKIFAVQLAANPKVYQLAHHQSFYEGYFTAPHAAVNRDFTMIAFTSNWRTQTSEGMDTYVIELPKNPFSTTATPVTVSPPAAPVASQPPVTVVNLVKDNFGNSLNDRVPDATSVNKNAWIVTVGSLSVEGGRLTSSVSHRAVVDSGASNVSVSASVSFATGGEAGLLVRYLDANNFLLFRVNSAGWYLRRNLNGVVSDLASGQLSFSVSTSHTIKVTAKGSAVDLFVNNVKVQSTVESTVLRGTLHGVSSSVASPVFYDSFTVDRS
eukprot:TRINITY_DN634_c0_g1_i4.p1 TRINITY_DN634_c0_g1~~TRINITY_DN634_c0_g1_i4.p1  ORF type:complete len:614 (-),score=134.29 TRINITY_DN634_c0_g1_i4:61-1902(-)